MKRVIREFGEFLRQYNVVGLAVAVIIGTQLSKLVSSLVNDLLMPLVLQPALRAANVEDIQQLHIKGIYYGKVAGAAIDFLVVAFIVFLLIKALTGMKEKAAMIANRKKQ